MHSPARSLLVLFAVAAAACSESSAPTTMLSPQAPAPEYARIKATDSLMTLTSTTYSDTSLVLKRLTPLASDISVSAVIDSRGGEIKIAEAGAKISFPAGALSSPTLITMTAFAGPNVAYDFQPHGIVFAQPVKVQQTIAGTWAAVFPLLLNGMHGSYYDTSLDAAWVDPLKLFALAKEHELGYVDLNASQIKFYVGHFSGYLVSCGRGE